MFCQNLCFVYVTIVLFYGRKITAHQLFILKQDMICDSIKEFADEPGQSKTQFMLVRVILTSVNPRHLLF